MDCIGLIGGVALALGVPSAPAWANDMECAGYGRKPDAVMLLTACAKYLEPAAGPLELGDVLVMRFADEPQHFAIVSALDPVYIIHAYAKARRVVEHRLDDEWQARIVVALRFPGID